MTEAIPEPSILPEPFILLAVDPALGGVYVWGADGAGATFSLATLAWGLTGRSPVRVPASLALESLYPRLDAAATLASGRLVHRPGLVDRASGRALVIEAADLLPAPLAAALASQLSQPSHQERPILFARGASCPLPSDPIGAHCGLWLEWTTLTPSGTLRAACLSARQANSSLTGSDQDWGSLRARIRAARRRLAGMSISPALAEEICRRVTAAGIRQQPLDYFAARLCLARAAWHGRTAVTAEDIEAALQWVVRPRLAEPAVESPPEPDGMPADVNDAQRTLSPLAGVPINPGTEGTAGAGDTGSAEGAKDTEQRLSPGGTRGGRGDKVAGEPPAIVVPPAHLPAALVLTGAPSEPRRVGTHRSADGRPEARALARRQGGPLALVPTLLAALPFQPLRPPKPPLAIRVLPEDLRWRRRRPRSRTLYILAVDGSGSMAQGRMHLAKGAAVSVLASAYRERRYVALIDFRHRSARLVCPPGRSAALLRRQVVALPSGGGTPLPAALALAARVVHRWRLRHPDGRAVLVLFTDGKANVPLPDAPRAGAPAGAGVARDTADAAPSAVSDDAAAAAGAARAPRTDHRQRAQAQANQLATRLRALGVPSFLVDTGPPGTSEPLLELARSLGARLVQVAFRRR